MCRNARFLRRQNIKLLCVTSDITREAFEIFYRTLNSHYFVHCNRRSSAFCERRSAEGFDGR